MPDRSSDSQHRLTSLDVVETVGNATDRSFETIPPLADTIDPDALNALFDSTGGHLFTSRSVSCSGLRGRVQVRGDGTVSAVIDEFVAEVGDASDDRGERLSNEVNPSAGSDTE